MNIPSQKNCLDLIHKMGMMDHIINHSIMVSKVAYFLVNNLARIHPALNVELTQRSALLHDITKTRSFTTGERHSETGKELLTNMGFPEVGDIIRQHVVLDHYDETGPITEIEIVNYSDKRILHDQIVSLDERIEYILTKYGKNKEYLDRINTMWENTIRLEAKLFKDLDFGPDSLMSALSESLNLINETSFHR